MNGEYIRKSQISSLKSQILEFDPTVSSIPNFEKYIPLAQTRMKTLADFRDLVERNGDAILNTKQRKLAEKLKEKYLKISNPEWKATSISNATIVVRDTLGASTKDVYEVLTGSPQGLPFEEKLEIQGQPGTISGLEAIIKNKK
jgi:hypothetical protein